MFSINNSFKTITSDFNINCMMRYSRFIPRLYNLCRSFGFEAGNIMPSRAFCSDESQGFPIILIAKHFGAFPFNHGRAGGVVAIERHGPHAHHGKEIVIIQASHVGYDPETNSFGQYCRLQTSNNTKTTTCGKLGHIIQWYIEELQFAQENIYIGQEGSIKTITIDNQLLDENRAEGLFLDLETMISTDQTNRRLIRTLSTSRVYEISNEFAKSLPENIWKTNTLVKIGDHIRPENFAFQKSLSDHDFLEKNLIKPMPWIVTSKEPMLTAAQFNTQAEFDRTYRSIIKSPDYRGKNLLFISCLNIDISPKEGQLFPLTKCVPWAAYIQKKDGTSQTIEQTELVDMLLKQSTENPDQIDLEASIKQMVEAQEITISV
tara:strand:+ start:166 stop:1293 length:1128 start_codon:yes stop_codon:yes gene_type:complete